MKRVFFFLHFFSSCFYSYIRLYTSIRHYIPIYRSRDAFSARIPFKRTESFLQLHVTIIIRLIATSLGPGAGSVAYIHIVPRQQICLLVGSGRYLPHRFGQSGRLGVYVICHNVLTNAVNHEGHTRAKCNPSNYN